MTPVSASCSFKEGANIGSVIFIFHVSFFNHSTSLMLDLFLNYVIISTLDTCALSCTFTHVAYCGKI